MFVVIYFYPCDAMLARVLAMALCLSVCHKSIVTDASSWFLARELPSTYPMLCCKNRVSPKISELPFGTLSQTPDIEIFAMAYQCQSMLSTQLGQGGHSKRDKLDRHWSTLLTIPTSGSVYSTIPSHGLILS